MKYEQPYGITDPDASYINGDPSIGRQGSIIPAAAVENHQRELIALIEAAGLVPAETDLTQVLQAVRSQRMNYAVDTGAANAVAVEFDPPIADTMTPGMPLRIKAAFNNTGATTLSTDGSSHPLRHADGSELDADDIKTGVVFGAVWNDGGYWEFNAYMGGGGGGGTSTTTLVNIPYIADTGATNALVANFVPAITSLVGGLTVEVRLANNITGASTIKVNALAPVAIMRPDGSPLQAGDAVAGQIMLLIYSASAGAFQFSGILPRAFSGMGVPVGGLILTLGNTPPAGTLKLNGALILRSEHPLLWAFANASNRIVNEVDWQNVSNRFWTAFSRGDGSTNFRLPDFRGEFPRWWDDGRGVDAARLLTTEQIDTVGNLAMSGIVTMNNPKARMDASGNPSWDAYKNAHNYEDGELAWNDSDIGDYGGDIYNKNDPGAPGLGTAHAKEFYWVAPGKNSAGNANWPGTSPWVHKNSSITGDMTLTGSGGGVETRPRNTAIVPCVVDG